MNTSNLGKLSHSALQTLRSCPRKFELDRLEYQPRDAGTAHTAFGHALGAGIQSLFHKGDLDIALFEAFNAWSCDLFDDIPGKKKSFFDAMIAIEKFYITQFPLMDEWELAYLKDGKPAIELGFAIRLPMNFWYRGFVDAVLKHKKTGALRVLELKSTGAFTVHESMYGKSFQGVGYSIILDSISTQMNVVSDYEVLYLVYKTASRTFEEMPFLKLISHRINWLHDLLLSVDMIALYKRVGRFPQNGDSCFSFGRPCKYYETCDISNDTLFLGFTSTEEEFDPTTFDFVFDYSDLVRNQSTNIKEQIRTTS
jgi:hypothetical protein